MRKSAPVVLARPIGSIRIAKVDQINLLPRPGRRSQSACARLFSALRVPAARPIVDDDEVVAAAMHPGETSPDMIVFGPPKQKRPSGARDGLDIRGVSMQYYSKKGKVPVTNVQDANAGRGGS